MRLYLSSFGFGNAPEEMVRLLAGKGRAAVIGNATDTRTPEERWPGVEREIVGLQKLGLVASEIDLRDYFGRASALEERLAGIDLIWARGGNAFLLRRAYRQSGADMILKRRLAEDSIVYAGYSAGPCCLVPSMKMLAMVDDPAAAPDGYVPEPIWEGLGILPYVLAPHYRSDHFESEAIGRMVERMIEEAVLFKALRDGEAIVHENGEERIVGRA